MQDRSGVPFTPPKSDDEQLLQASQPARPLALDLTEIEDRKQKGQLLC